MPTPLTHGRHAHQSQWVRSTSKVRSIDKRNPSPSGHLHKVQGLQRQTPKQDQDQGTHNRDEYGQQPPMRNRSVSANRSRGRSRSRGYAPEEYQYNPTMTYKGSIKSKRSQHSDAHMVRSISNKGNSASLGILELNMSDDLDDSNFFVR